jgi:endogenous inhibitor of DNA gyrase (YacG/DUF329 family)
MSAKAEAEAEGAKYGGGKANGLDLGEWDFGAAHIDPTKIPPRGWLLGIWLCRQFVSALFGDGAVGKTAFRIACALSLATARSDILGEHVFERARVLYVCFEDGKTELMRRICAAMLHHHIGDADIAGHLFVKAITNSQLKLAITEDFGKTSRGQLVEALKTAITRRQIDAVILDPLIKTHGVEENNNRAMDLVIEILTEIAVEHDIAVDTPHHVAKGANGPGNADSGRGASAVKDGGRLIYTLTPMTREEADLYNLSEDDRLSLVRIDQGKVNLVRRSSKVKWLRLAGVRLGNTFSPTYPRGDEIQVVEAWKPPDPFAMEKSQIAEIFANIRKGPHEGERYSSEPTSNDWAGDMIKTITGKSKKASALVLSTWIENGVLLRNKYRSPARKNEPVWGLSVDDNKAREILGSLHQPAPEQANPTSRTAGGDARKCKECGAPLALGNSTRLFCSDRCQKAAKRRREAEERQAAAERERQLEQTLVELLARALAENPDPTATAPYSIWRRYAESAGISEGVFASGIRRVVAKGIVKEWQDGALAVYGLATQTCTP